MEDIIVCVKQVPKIRNISLDQKYHTLIREGIPNILNPHDVYALEAALECKKKFGVKVGVVTMGPPQAKEILQYCLKKGVDDTFLITDKRIAGSDTIVTARILASFILKTNFRNVFCGQESLDSGTGHIGPSIAEILNLPQVTYIKKIVGFFNDKLRISSEFECGYRIIDIRLPAVLSFNRGKNRKRSVSKSLDVSNLKIINIEDLGITEDNVGIKGSLTQVISVNFDESLINYLIVPNSLSPLEKINYVLKGGITENRSRKVVQYNTDDDIFKVVKLIDMYKQGK